METVRRLESLVNAGVQIYEVVRIDSPWSNRPNVVVGVFRDGGMEYARYIGQIYPSNSNQAGNSRASGEYEILMGLLQKGGVSLPEGRCIHAYVHTLELPNGKTVQYTLPSLRYYAPGKFNGLEPHDYFAEQSARTLGDLPWSKYNSPKNPMGSKAREALLRAGMLTVQDVVSLFQEAAAIGRPLTHSTSRYGTKLDKITHDIFFEELGIRLPYISLR